MQTRNGREFLAPFSGRPREGIRDDDRDQRTYLIGRAIVSVADGEKVGMIANLQLDLAERVVLGFLVGGDGGIFNREKPAFVPFAQVRTFGRDAMTIEDKRGIAVAEGAPHDTAAMLGDLKKRVVTAGGEVIGDGEDVLFDETSGAITALQLASQGGFLGIGAATHVLPVEEIVGFGCDVITVHDSALARIRPEAGNQQPVVSNR
ncbi:MAG: PRC-barrel domain-containing protein [Thermomicrobia bacterium]|nr:PRC-barrel domain-containing protein [Thermomicrobia bacterium]